MRKFIAALLSMSTLVALVATLATSAPAGAASVETCLGINPSTGSPYYAKCTDPKILVATPVSAKCTKKSTNYKTAKFLVEADAAIRSITVKFNGTTLYSATFAGIKTTSAYVGPLSIATGGLSAGTHYLTIVVKDTRPSPGSATKTVPFSVCKAKAVTTG